MLLYYVVFILSVAGLGQSSDEDCKGCVPLDAHSFDKVISKFKASLVKFDVAFPYGEKHEEFAKVAAATKDSIDLLIAEVGVKDYGKKENSDLAQRYGITKDDYPAVRLFLQGKTEPIPFIQKTDSDFTAENLKRFIRAQSDVYLGLPGCVEQLDRLAEEFKTSQDKERQEILGKAKIFEETLPEEHRKAAQVYVKTMERILERGDVFVQLEQSRLEGLLNGKISKDKKRNMEERRNILQSFAHRDEL
ncbi:endoplasmic reticulum resident protein 29 [Athalia rosae]|uniref:endoplasmic reticulum resident protein 29 n=1 Tax=Athalia rosae TaxID=37344 RepID=UPI00062554F1|nr:endoplasmic reticulum resident protein 29 [Athalia rosae]